MLITGQDLQLTIDGYSILRGINLHLEPGEIYGLLGPNGAGKSTTIFVLLGLYRRDAGKLSVLGADPNDNAVKIRREIGVMPEHAGFYDWMTSGEYLQWYARLYGRRISDKTLKTLLEQVGLASAGDRRIGRYSLGMKQRLAMARAFVPDPRLLILDEPTNGLDPKGRRKIHDLLLNLAQEQKVGILLCTHLLDDVDRLCNRIGIIDEGHTVLEGPLSELLVTHGAGLNYRLRLECPPDTSYLPFGLDFPRHELFASPEHPPDTSYLPAGVSLLAQEGEWWHIKIETGTYRHLPLLWEKLLHHGWRITEIRSERGGLEELYLQTTSQSNDNRREGMV